MILLTYRDVLDAIVSFSNSTKIVTTATTTKKNFLRYIASSESDFYTCTNKNTYFDFVILFLFFIYTVAPLFLKRNYPTQNL